MHLFFSLLSALLISLLACYAVGTAVCRALGMAPHEAWFTVFVRLVVGVGTAVAGYAALCTGGRTVLLPLLGLLPLVVWQLRRPNALGPGPTAPPLLAPPLARALAGALLAGVVVFAGRWLLLHDPASPYLYTPFQDYVYYGRLSLALNRWGIETSALATGGAAPAPAPYHYLELWLNAALVRFTGLPSVWTLYLGTYSVLIAVVVTGFRAVLAHTGLRGGPAAVLALLLVLVTGVFWPAFAHSDFLHNGVYVASNFLVAEPKTAPVYLLVLLAALLLLQARYGAAATALAGLPLVFISTAPASLMSMVGLAAYLALRRKIAPRAALAMAALAVAVAGFIGAFYWLSAHSASAPPAATSRLAGPWLPTLGELPTLLNVALGTLVSLAIYYAPYALLLAGLWAVARQRSGRWPGVGGWDVPAAWLVLSVLAAAATRAFAVHLVDSFQFFSNLVVPLAAVALALALGTVLPTIGRAWSGLAAAVLVGLGVVHGAKLVSSTTPLLHPSRYSAAFLRRVEAVLPSLGSRGGFIMADADYELAYMLNSDTYSAGTYVSNFKNDYALVSLSAPTPDRVAADPRFTRDSAYSRSISQASEFYQWKQAHRRAVAGRPDSALYRFVTQSGIRFVCVSRRGALPPVLSSLVQGSHRDAWSGEKFYALKPRHR